MELYEENGTATDVHTNAMRKILRERGGFVGIRPDVAEMMAMYTTPSPGCIKRY